MSGENWTTARIWFRKTGRARYISHLDLNRCMSRAMQKAKIPLWHTEGFNPHAFMTFALPLSLGIDGIRESMDIRLEAPVEKDEMIQRLNRALPADIRVFDVTQPVMKPGKIAYASFEITIQSEQEPAQQVADRIMTFLAQEKILVKKKSKSGIKEIDLKPFLDIRNLRVERDQVQFTAMLPAGSTQNINPFLFFEAMESQFEVELYPQIVRTNLYDQDGVEFQ